jgi:hypothetical protein
MRPELLNVVCVISNPVRYNSRYQLFKKFEEKMLKSGVQLYVVETQQGERPFQVTDSFDRKHIQLRTFDELWIKENMINIGISRLPKDWEYVAWVDADIEFLRPDWATETVQQLQSYEVVQMFETAIDMGPQGETLNVHHSFMSEYVKGGCKPPIGPGYGYYGVNESRALFTGKRFWHPGYAWAARREAFDSLGGLIDFCILGSADHSMAMGLIGLIQRSAPKDINKKFLNELEIWQQRAEAHIKRDVGYVPGSILHSWHGKKKDRKYVERWDIIRNNDFDPDDDLKRDWQGLLQLEVLTPRQRTLRDQIRQYLRQRNEDSVDVI